MKKLALISVVLLSCLVMLSFKSDKSNLQEFTITVTSDKQIEFDMYQSVAENQTSTLTGLKTPYNTTVLVADGRFIFKQKELGNNLQIKFSNNATVLTADWPITVVLVEGNKVSTFGMN